MSGAAKHSFFTPDPSAPIPEGAFYSDREPWSDDDLGASVVFFDLIQRYRRVARIGRELRVAQPNHEELQTVRELLRHGGARIRARLESYAPTDRQRKHPH